MINSTTGLNILLRALFITGALAFLQACASGPEFFACPDLSGTYANESSPAGVTLAGLLLKLPPSQNGRAVSLTSSASATKLAVAFGYRQSSLRQGRDYACNREGLELVYTSTTGSEIPLFASTSETTRYTLKKTNDGLLHAMRQIKTSGVAYEGSSCRPLARR